MLRILPGRFDAVPVLLEGGGHAPPNHRRPVALHVLTDVLRDLLVKAPEENRAGHDVSVVAQAGEEARALKGDVAGAHDESLARGLGQLKQVVGGQAELLVPGDAQVARAAPHGHHEIGPRERDGLPVALGRLDGVRPDEAAEGVDVLHLLLAQLDAVAEVE